MSNSEENLPRSQLTAEPKQEGNSLNERDWIAYVGPFRFPEGEAASRRVLGIANSLAMGGENIVVGCGAKEPLHAKNIPENEASRIKYIGLNEWPPLNPTLMSKAARSIFGFGKHTVAWLNRQKTRPKCVILYGGYSPYLVRLQAWCKQYRTPLIADVVEWYDGSHVAGGRFGPMRLNVELAMRRLFPKCDGIIAISSFLQEYYRARGCKTIRIPPTLDVKEIPIGTGSREERTLTIAYAGVPGKKDLILNVCECLLQHPELARNVRFSMVGPTDQELLAMPPFVSRGINAVPHWLDARGRVSHEEAMNTVANADATVLVRAPQRYANAGFSTKVTESLSVGTPVICNLTSDLPKYIHEGAEGIVCADHSTKAFANALGRMLEKTASERNEMRTKARLCAENHFDSSAYTCKILDFVRSLAS